MSQCTTLKPMIKVLAQSSQTKGSLGRPPPTPPSSSSTGSHQLHRTNISTIINQKTNEGSSLASLAYSLSTFLTTLHHKLINPPLGPSVDPKFVLTGNFAPVAETHPTECSIVEGQLPPSLNGAYIRNGPNPQHQPLGPYHVFDGDGMIHSIRLSQGRATFCSRYVHTYKYKLERDSGGPVMPNFLAGFYSLADLGRLISIVGRIMLGQINLLHGFGLANTSVTLLGKNLYAMNEIDLPYAVRLTQEGDIETMGRCDLAGKAPASMTAHPKVDPETGEVFAFRWSLILPYLNFFRLDANGCKQQDVPIFSMNHYVHDFAITKHFAIFPESQLEIASIKMMVCKGMPVRYRPTKVPRVGVIPRYATSGNEMRWFPTPGFNAFHIVNAWEDDDDGVVVIAPNGLSPKDFLEDMDKVHFSLEKLRIDLRTGSISRTILSERSLELGSINPSYLRMKNRYVYMAVGEHVPKMSGVVKIDLELGCEVASRSYGPGCFGGEAFFVPKDADDEPAGCKEDDGFVVSFVHNDIADESRFVVMDAKSPTLLGN